MPRPLLSPRPCAPPRRRRPSYAQGHGPRRQAAGAPAPGPRGWGGARPPGPGEHFRRFLKS
eukprot:5714807-Alexandrium_andersonii.AAC.1